MNDAARRSRTLRPHRRGMNERGAGSALVIGAMLGLVIIMIMCIWLMTALSVSKQVRGAADLVALAAAQAQANGRDACTRAAKVAATNRVDLDGCTCEVGEGEFVVTVRVSAVVIGAKVFQQRMRAEAAAGYLQDGP